ncbi:MAG: hypothetical protein ACTSWD_02490 [Candidatus Heimdallarchaeota archaeon]
MKAKKQYKFKIVFHDINVMSDNWDNALEQAKSTMRENPYIARIEKLYTK